ncbi:hypothetical protein E5Q_03085 [Mixia osmundae IAM 14324]|uniref:Uncharacterized protein n=2 Tax=Mixia osmundae (strain CBS 9802 / IAM 14324 / JCM 22182 / KY 12970) TaxID=764103 RepID=G7E0Q8_MIXOS|nr:hypothetical protein E5Q_03085 [Mixia osmundae IAM 14324]
MLTLRTTLGEFDIKPLNQVRSYKITAQTASQPPAWSPTTVEVSFTAHSDADQQELWSDEARTCCKFEATGSGIFGLIDPSFERTSSDPQLYVTCGGSETPRGCSRQPIVHQCRYGQMVVRPVDVDDAGFPKVQAYRLQAHASGQCTFSDSQTRFAISGISTVGPVDAQVVTVAKPRQTGRIFARVAIFPGRRLRIGVISSFILYERQSIKIKLQIHDVGQEQEDWQTTEKQCCHPVLSTTLVLGFWTPSARSFAHEPPRQMFVACPPSSLAIEVPGCQRHYDGKGEFACTDVNQLVDVVPVD